MLRKYNVYKRKDGRWEGRIPHGKRKNGKRRYKYVFAKSRDEVIHRIDEMNFGSSSGVSNSYTEGESFSHAVTATTTSTEGVSIGDGTTNTTGTSNTITVEIENKMVIDLTEKIEMQLQRLEQGFAYGGFDVGCYFYSEDYVTAVSAMSICKGLFSGQNSSIEQAHVNVWNSKDRGDTTPYLLANICYMQHPLALLPVVTAAGSYATQYAMPTTMLTVNEVPIIFNLPKKSVDGVAVLERAEFARTVIFERPIENRDDIISIGRIYHMGKLDSVKPEDLYDTSKEWIVGHRVELNMQLFSSHCLICGSSGSGKSWGTYHLLNTFWEKGCKIMIIEPVKGEYKEKFGSKPGITVYNVNPNIYQMLKINPFCFPKSIHIASHMKKVMDICKASWSLTAAMPNLLEKAIRMAYEQCGWDIDNSVHIDGFSDKMYPTFSDVVALLPQLIDESEYSAENKGNYKGALITRVQSMAEGLIGMIFEDEYGIDDKKLFDEDVIIDLSEIGSEDTNALIMGVLIMRLNEYRQDQRRIKALKGGTTHDEPLKHITVLEEAHNLLRRTSTEQNDEGTNPAGASVRAISNSIKEMRTYGEGFLIIDQTPSALDDSAIENTSTKIVFNTPGKDASETLCNALALNEAQKQEISRLTTGVAVCYHKAWVTPPVLMQIDGSTPACFERELEHEDKAEIKVVRADLLYQFFNDIKNKNSTLNLNQYFSIIQNSTLSSDQKARFTVIVRKHINKSLLNEGKFYYSLLNTTKRDEFFKVGFAGSEVGKFIFDLLGCKSVFSMLFYSKQLRSKYSDCQSKQYSDALFNSYYKLHQNVFHQLMVNKKDEIFARMVAVAFLGYQRRLSTDKAKNHFIDMVLKGFFSKK